MRPYHLRFGLDLSQARMVSLGGCPGHYSPERSDGCGVQFCQTDAGGGDEVVELAPFLQFLLLDSPFRVIYFPLGARIEKVFLLIFNIVLIDGSSYMRTISL